MKLSSGDGYTHRFLIDLDGDPNSPPDTSDCPSIDPCSNSFSTTPITYNFTIPITTTPGNYEYICVVHYPNMVGQFVVHAATTPNFVMTTNPGSLTFLQGSSDTSTITVSSQNGFSGIINLSATSSPTGPTTSLNPTSVTITAGTSKTSILSVNSTGSTPSGSYTVTITGTNGTLPHTATVSVTINAPATQDFSITTNPTSLNVAQGGTGTTTITINSLNGFSGTVNLAGSVSPSGPTVSFSPSSVTVSGGSATSTLTFSAAGGYYNTVANGSYSVNVTATSGSRSHSTTVQATVGSSNLSSGTLPLSSTLLIGIVVVIIAAVAVTVFLIRRKPATSM
jgi:uncharacterized membrane protein